MCRNKQIKENFSFIYGQILCYSSQGTKFWLVLEHNDIICLWNVSSLPIVIPKGFSEGIDSIVEPSIFKLIFSYGLTKNWLLPEFATSQLFLNQANILLMVGSKNSIASA